MASKINNSYRRYRTRREGKKIKNTQKETTKFEYLKVGYLNIDVVNTHSLEEVRNTLECKKLTIAILAETKIRQEDDYDNLEIEGYKFFQIRQSDGDEDKQGGV